MGYLEINVRKPVTTFRLASTSIPTVSPVFLTNWQLRNVLYAGASISG